MVAKSQGKHLGRPQMNLSTLSKQQIDIYRRNSSKMEEWRNNCCYVNWNVRAKEKHVL